MRSPWPSSLLMVLAVLVALTFARTSTAADHGTGMDFSISALGEWMPYVPTLSAPSTDFGWHHLPGGRLPSPGGVFFWGVQVDWSFVARRRWVFPLLGVETGFAIGSSAATLTSFDGSIAEVEPWTAYRVTALLPGVGVRARIRRWSFAVTARPTAVVVGANTRLAFGSGSIDLSEPFRLGVGARADLEACRRLDPEDRVCAFVAPNLYELGAMNGGTAGLRWELGL